MITQFRKADFLVSIHSPRRSEGRPHSRGIEHDALCAVSIHSPRRSEGRRSTNSRDIKIVMRKFQSTPPAEARGDDSPDVGATTP